MVQIFKSDVIETIVRSALPIRESRQPAVFGRDIDGVIESAVSATIRGPRCVKSGNAKSLSDQVAVAAVSVRRPGVVDLPFVIGHLSSPPLSAAEARAVDALPYARTAKCQLVFSFPNAEKCDITLGL